MADQKISPTPYPLALGNRRVLIPPDIIGTEKITIKAGWILGVPTVWELEFLRLSLTTDATVANRYAAANIYTSEDNAYKLAGFRTAAIAASLTKSLSVSSAATLSNAAMETDFWVGMSRPVVFSGDQELVINVTTGKAGDSLSAVVVLKFKNREEGMPDYSEYAWRKNKG